MSSKAQNRLSKKILDPVEQSESKNIEKTSRLPKLHNDSVNLRRRRIEDAIGLLKGRLDRLEKGLGTNKADKMTENVVGTHELPIGIATNFIVDGREVLVPMVIEEPSVVAAASNGALRARAGGGFFTDVDDSLTVAQVQICHVPDMARALLSLKKAKKELINKANQSLPEIVHLGGGARDFELRPLEKETLVIHLIVDCLDAMGANIVNTMAEAIAPRVEELTGGKVGLRILTNLMDRRIARARCVIPTSALKRKSALGETVRDGVINAYYFADLDPYRAATHNKGVMNGIDAVVIATGNDWRAVEAGAHAYASRSGQYKPLTRWSSDSLGNLVGEIELPLGLGTVGGASRVHPCAKIAFEILNVKGARELSAIVAAVGLAQNLSALSALANEGIQQGHMALHARSLAMSAGAQGDEVELVAKYLRKTAQRATVTEAREILDRLRHRAKTEAVRDSQVVVTKDFTPKKGQQKAG